MLDCRGAYMTTCQSLGLPTGWRCDEVQVGDAGPVLVIFDEHHGTAAAIDESIALAKQLISRLGVKIVGVEGFACRNDPYTGQKCHPGQRATAIVPGAECLTDNMRFAYGIVGCGAVVVGVDSEGYYCELDLCGKPVANMPQNVARSECFVTSLFEERSAQELDGALILNCGSNHGEHIMDFARGSRPRPADWPTATYVRLRPPSHP